MKKIPLCVPTLGQEEKEALIECIDSTFVSMVGPKVQQFEQEFAAYVGSKYAVACSSGTAAIHLALEVIKRELWNRQRYYFVPTFSFAASVNPVYYVRGNKINYFMDACKDTWSLDLLALIKDKDFKSYLSNIPQGGKVTIIIPHLYGTPAKSIKEFTEEYKENIFVIEDATESLGTFVGKKHVGTFGDFGCFSFNGNKMITTGSGGMLVTDNKEFAEKAKSLSQQSKRDKVFGDFRHDDIGYNYRLTNLQAALGLAQLKKLPEFIKRKKEIFKKYDETFMKKGSIWKRQVADKNVDVAPWLYSMITNDSDLDLNKLREYSESKGIDTRGLWYPLHLQVNPETSRDLYTNCLLWWPEEDGDEDDEEYTYAEHLHNRGISLPSSVSMTLEEQEYVIDSITNYLKK